MIINDVHIIFNLRDFSLSLSLFSHFKLYFLLTGYWTNCLSIQIMMVVIGAYSLLWWDWPQLIGNPLRVSSFLIITIIIKIQHHHFLYSRVHHEEDNYAWQHFISPLPSSSTPITTRKKVFLYLLNQPYPFPFNMKRRVLIESTRCHHH